MGAFVAEIVKPVYAGACTIHTDWMPPLRASKEEAQNDVYDHEEEVH